MNADAAHGDEPDDGLDGGARRGAPPIPVHVISGFLGSGKTTLLNRMMRDPALAKSAVVVNEFGDIGVDHALVSQGGDEDRGLSASLALVGGCLCCELRAGLALTLVDLLARRQRGQCMAFERIIIETSGLADPTPVLNLPVADPVLAEQTVPGSVLAVVDAINGPHTLTTYAEAVTQVVLADRIVVTKTDLERYLPHDGIASLTRRLRALNPGAVLHENGVNTLSSLACLLARVRKTHSLHDAGNDAGHTHSHLHAAGIDSFSIVREAPVPGAALTLLVQALAAHLGTDLLRMKGFVRVAESPHRALLLQGAQRVFHPLLPLDTAAQAIEADSAPAVRLVFIVRGRWREFVEQLFDALVWETRDVSARLVQSMPGAKAGI